MPEFHFPLEGVLRHRTNIERDRMRALGEAQQAAQTLQNDLQSLDQSLQRSTDDLRTNHLTGRIDLNYLAAHRRFVASVQRKATGLIQRLALAQRRVDEARAALAEAARQRKIIEKLREKQESRWRAELNRKELAEADEVAMQMGFASALGDVAIEPPGGES
jgi:flagellar protein FliJ